MRVLKLFAIKLGVDFDRGPIDDIRRLVRVLEETSNYSPYTKVAYKAILKRFFKWLKGTPDSSPDEVKWISTRIKATDKRAPAHGDLLTEQEISQLISIAGHPRDKALVAVLYESGARIGEIGSLKYWKRRLRSARRRAQCSRENWCPTNTYSLLHTISDDMVE